MKAESEDGDKKAIVDFDPSIPKQWKSGASFGNVYIQEHITKRTLFPKSGRVRVANIRGHAVDTNNVVIAFVVTRALVNALGIEPTKKPEFDKEMGTVTFSM